MTQKQSVSELIQEAIDKGATTVEDIHKSIADLPLKVLERSHLFEKSAKEVQRVQDISIGAIYDLIRDINEKVGSLATELLAKANERKAGGHVSHAKRRAAHGG